MKIQLMVIRTLFLIVSSCCIFIHTYAYELPDNIADIIHEDTPQNAVEYIPIASRDTVVADVNKLRLDYLQHFFSPWHQQNLVAKLTVVQAEQLARHLRLLLNPGWGGNANKHTREWVRQLIDNSNLVKVPNLGMRAIVTCDTNARTLPTNEPVLTDWLLLRKGYPFDRMQESLLKVGTPIFIMNISKDGAWYFILTASYTGWIPSNDAAFVSAAFVSRWERYSYVTMLDDDISLLDHNWQFMAKASIGNIYPLHTETRSYYKIFFPVPDASNYAQAKSVYLPKKYATKFPLSLTVSNVALMVNKLSGQAYGWGGMYGLRDCSAMMMDIFTPFGIWLPRNSGQQIQGQGYFDFAKLSKHGKVKAIKEHGVPFMTILHLPGHIGLYLGEKNGKLYMFHNTLSVENNLINALLQRPRKVVGRAVITSLNFGHTHFYSADSLLDKIIDMRVLVNESLRP